MKKLGNQGIFMANLGRAQWIRISSNGGYRFYKSCPRCCKHFGHLEYKFIFSWDGSSTWPDARGSDFGITEKRVSKNNPFGAQSLCLPCRGNKGCTRGQKANVLETMGRIEYGRWKDGDFEVSAGARE